MNAPSFVEIEQCLLAKIVFNITLRETNRQTDRRTNGWIDGQTDVGQTIMVSKQYELVFTGTVADVRHGTGKKSDESHRLFD